MLFNKTFCDASVDWQFGFQEPATPTAEGILDFHDYLVFFGILICILVFFCILILVFLPLINFSKIRSSEFRHIFSFFYWVLFRRIIILFGKKKKNLIIKIYLYPVTKIKDPNVITLSILFTVYNNNKEIFDTKICYFNYFINNKTFEIKYLQESLYNILFTSTKISMEEANLFNSKFEEYILNIVKEERYKNSVGPWFISLTE